MTASYKVLSVAFASLSISARIRALIYPALFVCFSSWASISPSVFLATLTTYLVIFSACHRSCGVFAIAYLPFFAFSASAMSMIATAATSTADTQNSQLAPVCTAFAQVVANKRYSAEFLNFCLHIFLLGRIMASGRAGGSRRRAPCPG